MTRIPVSFSMEPDDKEWVDRVSKGIRSDWLREKIREARGMDVESKRKLIEDKKAKAAMLLDEVREEEEDLKTYIAGLAVIKSQEREVRSKAKAVEAEVTDVSVVANAIRMAKAFVKDKDIEGAQRYLAPLVKTGKLTPEEADKILSGSGA